LLAGLFSLGRNPVRFEANRKSDTKKDTTFVKNDLDATFVHHP
jgi:hypothetical protein